MGKLRGRFQMIEDWHRHYSWKNHIFQKKGKNKTAASDFKITIALNIIIPWIQCFLWIRLKLFISFINNPHFVDTLNEVHWSWILLPMSQHIIIGFWCFFFFLTPKPGSSFHCSMMQDSQRNQILESWKVGIKINVKAERI